MSGKALNESVLRRLTRLDKLQFYCMLLCPFSQCQRDKFRTIIHTQHDRITAVCRDPVEHTDHSRSWQIQIYFNRQRLTVKVINNIERAKMTPTDQASCIKSTDQLWFSASGVASGEGLRTGSRCLPLRRKFSFCRQ